MPPASLPTTADVAVRALYQYANYGVGGVAGADDTHNADDVTTRAQYLYVNHAVHGHPVGGETMGSDDVLARVLYLYVNVAHDRDPSDVAARAVYEYVAYSSDEIFPWIERIVPTEQSVGGQVEIMGDGFGATEAAEGGSVRLGLYDPTMSGPGMLMGVVSWSTRSPNLHPANSGIRSTAAIVATVPEEAESGLLSVEENT